MEQESGQTLEELLADLAQLSRQYQDIVAPYRAQIVNIEIAREAATAAITFQMETLEALIRPFILATKETHKMPYLTVVYQRREKWDRDLLFRMARELPAIMQAYEATSVVQFRKTAY